MGNGNFFSGTDEHAVIFRIREMVKSSSVCGTSVSMVSPVTLSRDRTDTETDLPRE